MDDDQLITWLFAATRAVHFIACLLIFCVPVFDRVVVPRALPEMAADRWRWIARWLMWMALPAALVSGAAWLALNAINMSGLPPSEALRPDILRLVLSDTHFGKLWEFRAGLWLAAIACAVALAARLPPVLRAMLLWFSVIAGGMLAASLAWAGHGLTSDPQPLHLWADAAHILIGGVWPMGLLPFAMLFAALRRTPDISKWQPIALLTRRFSAFSLASVAIMLLTGLINSLALVGSPSLLLSTLYGRVLVTKVAAFMVMIALGAMNLLRLKPRLAVDLAEGTATEGEPAARRLGANVRVELVLMILVMLLVGVLGLLAPAADAVMHERHH